MRSTNPGLDFHASGVSSAALASGEKEKPSSSDSILNAVIASSLVLP
jgi:hypothetical protein